MRPGWRRRSESLRTCGRAAGLALLTVMLAACGTGEPPDGQRARATTAGMDADITETGSGADSYIGSAACAGCHAAEHALWNGSHHDLALQTASAATVLGNFDDAEFEYQGVVSRFRRDGEAFFVATDDAGGAIREFRVVHTFGVEPLQQYLVEYERGRLQALSIAWDARPAEAGGQRWFHLYEDDTVSAGDPLHWTGPFQNWNSMCADCHSTGVAKNYDVDSDSYATTFEIDDVGCEACHGPGGAHAAGPAANPLAHGRVGRTWVFDEGSAIAARAGSAPPLSELETCAACHSRRSQFHDTQAPAGYFESYRPESLEREGYYDDGQIRGEVYVYGSFMQSRMHAAGVTCSDCHEPHSLELRAPGDALCARCHASDVFGVASHHGHLPAGVVGAPVLPGCIDCHMRAETYMRIDPRRDHSFRVPRPDLAATLGSPNPCNDCHRDRTADWAAARVAEWRGGRAPADHFGSRLAAVRDWQAEPAVTLGPLLADAASPPIVRATALRALGDAINGIDSATLAAVAGDPSELVRLALAEAASALTAERRVSVVQRFLSDAPAALRIAAAQALLPLQATLTPGRQADLAAAGALALEAARYNGDRPEGLVTAATLSGLGGDTEAARGYLEIAVARFPWFVPAWVNLADLERAAGRNADSLEHVDAGLARAPDSAPLMVSRGLALVRLDRLDEAVAALERAQAVEPEDPYNWYVLGLALQAVGREADARALLRDGVARFPAYTDFLFVLATIARDAGNRDEAIGYARQGRATAAWDSRFAALMAELDGA